MNKKELKQIDKFFQDPDNINYPQDGKYFYKKPEPEQKGRTVIMKQMEMNDGFTISVQASYGHYCFPQKTYRSEYSNIYQKYELGYPSEEEELIEEYAEGGDLTSSVYPQVPKEVLAKVVKKHGGIKKALDK